MSDEGMTKYGVELDNDRVKEASEGEGSTSELSHCPVCSQNLDDGGACPTHGTAPFEGRQ